jgi:hypothetical protein
MESFRDVAKKIHVLVQPDNVDRSCREENRCLDRMQHPFLALIFSWK